MDTTKSQEPALFYLILFCLDIFRVCYQRVFLRRGNRKVSRIGHKPKYRL